MFKKGDRVQTNMSYFKRTGRIVRGTIIKLYCDVPPGYVGMIWEEQVGNIDERMQGLKVLMDGNELEFQ